MSHNATRIPIYSVRLPQYRIDTAPDHEAIGKILDKEIKKHFLGHSILVRGVASSEHPDKTVDELIEIIRTTGTDRYDPARTGDRYDNIEGKHIDLFAFPMNITKDSKELHNLIWGFYHSAIDVHGRPMRIDIITIYDTDHMRQVLHQYEGRDDIKDDGFVFKNPQHKTAALKALIKIEGNPAA
jgi:hypothetical protein